MNRRTLIKTATGAAVLPFVNIGRATALAPKGGGSTTAPWASAFSGADRLQMNAYGPQWPAASQRLLFAWITQGAAPIVKTRTNTQPTISMQDTSAGSVNAWLYYIVNATQSQLQFTFNFGSAPGVTGTLYGAATSQTLSSYTTGLNRTILYVDLSIPQVVVTVNRKQIATSFDTAGWNSSAAIQFGTWGGSPLRLSAGGWPGNQTAGGFKGTAAEWTMFLPGQAINILDPTFQDRFQNSDGTMTSWFDLTPNGSNLIPGLLPVVYLSGGPPAFKHSLKRGTNNNGITTLSYQDADYFTSVAGPGITFASIDPWNNVGVS